MKIRKKRGSKRTRKLKSHLLPEPSANFNKIVALLQQKEKKFSELLKDIEDDSELSSRMFSLLNSGAYGIKDVKSMQKAIPHMKNLYLKELLFSSVCYDFFDGVNRYEWEHAYSSSLLATEIVKRYGFNINNELQLIALLHDVGKGVLQKKGNGQYHYILSKIHEAGTKFLKFEHSVMYCDHSNFGAWLLEAWGMPKRITMPIFYHHEDTPPPEFVHDTSILRFINWVDHQARGTDCTIPHFEECSLTNVLKDDLSYWIDFQKELITLLDSSTLVVA